MIQKYFKCEVCHQFTPIIAKGRASKYCGVSCRSKAYYRRHKAGEPLRYNLHGLSYHPLYQKWEAMMDRCYNPNRNRYARYGGRGIKVCERWHNAANYIADIEALGPRPSAAHTIDRIDNDGHYEPGNVRWLDQTNQNFNQANRRDNTSGHRGVTWDASRQLWSASLGLKGKTLYGGRFETFEGAVKARHKLQRDNGVEARCCN